MDDKHHGDDGVLTKDAGTTQKITCTHDHKSGSHSHAASPNSRTGSRKVPGCGPEGSMSGLYFPVTVSEQPERQLSTHHTYHVTSIIACACCLVLS